MNLNSKKYFFFNHLKHEVAVSSQVLQFESQAKH